LKLSKITDPCIHVLYNDNTLLGNIVVFY